VTQISPIDIWIIPLDPPDHALDDAWALLSKAERSQAGRFKFPEIQRRYVMAHAGLRKVLAVYIPKKPEAILYEVNPFGKPALVGRSTPGNIQFNLSHSGELALVAVSRDMPVGIDVEGIKALTDHLRIAERYFSPDEKAALKLTDPSKSHEAFIQLWAGKEAFIKARGNGLSLPLDQFSLAALIARPRGHPCTITDPVDGRTWWVSPLCLEPGYAGAVCIKGVAAAIQYHEL
jgi:4'-phosphopantetheinyl transferase